MEISEERLQSMIEEAAKKGVKEYAAEQKKKTKKNKFHDTYALMKCYRDLVFHIDNAVSEGSQMAADDYASEQEEMYLRSIRRTRFRTMVAKAHIDTMLEEMKRRREEQGREIEYKAFEMYFMEGVDYPQIANELETGVNTPRRWINNILKEMAVLLWGIDMNE